MNQITETILTVWKSSRKTKQTSSGWISGNAPCCHHNGQTIDKRGRGGILTSADGGFNYHCFNCNFKAGWSPGKLLSSNTKKLFKWLGLSDADVGKLNLVALKIKDDQPAAPGKAINLNLHEIKLPDNCRPINDLINEGNRDPDLLEVIKYLVDERKMDWDWYPWHWSDANGYRDRVIIPFYQDGKIVGYTGRKVKPGKPKYLTDSQPGYVFNLDRQHRDRQYVIVVEGQFDAISIDGVALMTNEPNDAQVLRINALGREVICVPDRDRPGAKMLDHAIKNNWSVSLPPWGDDVKDVADAVKKYGRLYVLTTVLHYKVQGEIKIQLLKKKLEALDD